MRDENPWRTSWWKSEFDFLLQTAREAKRHDAKDLAATIAFWAFLSIFPLLIAIFSLAGYFLQSSQVQARIIEVVSDFIPGSASLVQDNLKAVVRNRGTMSWIGIGALLWTASKAFGAIARAINRALETTPTHPALLSRVRYFLMAVAVSILTIASIGVTVAIEIVLKPAFLSRLGLAAIEAPRLRGWILTFLLVFLVFALIYRLAPSVKVSWRQVLPGTLLAAVLFELVKAAFVLYLDRFADFEAVYGSLSSIIVLLLWLYLSALILVYGAEYNIVRSKADAAPTETAPKGSK